MLRCSLNRAGHLSRDCLIRTKRLGTDGGVESLKVAEEAFRDALFSY